MALATLGSLLGAVSFATALSISEFPTPTEVSRPAGIAAGTDGNVWFTESWPEARQIGRITPEGQITEFQIPFGGNLSSIAAGADGNMWFTDGLSDVGQITPSGKVNGFEIPTEGDRQTDGIALGSDGNLWFREVYPSAIGRITPKGQLTEFPLPESAGVPLRLAAGADGNVWFTLIQPDAIGRITPKGQITVFPLLNLKSEPFGITAGLGKEMWFTERAAQKIGRIDVFGNVTEFALANKGSPEEIIVGPDGKLWFTLAGSGKLGSMTLSGEITEYDIPTENSVPSDIVTGPDGRIWFTEWLGNKIGRFAVSTPLSVSKVGTGSGTVTSFPSGIDCGETCESEFDGDSTIVLTATPDKGSKFTGWKGCDEGGVSGTACKVTLNEAKTVTAQFDLVAPNKPLFVESAGTGSGTVLSKPPGIECGKTCEAEFEEGTTVLLTANPEKGSKFVGWQGGECSGTGFCEVTMTAATEVVATFDLIPQRKLSVVMEGGGSGIVTSSPPGIECGKTCEAEFEEGTTVLLTATPDKGSKFTGWKGCNKGGVSGTSCKVTLSEAKTVTAHFDLVAPSVTLAVDKIGTGTGSVFSKPTGIGCGAICEAEFEEGTTVLLTATPDKGSKFTGWSGGGCSGMELCEVTMTAAKTVTATFELVPRLKLSVTNAGTGSGTVLSEPPGIKCGEACEAEFEEGSVVSLVAIPDSGSKFTGWSGGGCSGTGICKTTLSESKEVTATFELIPRQKLSIVKEGTGSGTVFSEPSGIKCGEACEAEFAEGQGLALFAVPDSGSKFTGWSGGGCSGMGSCKVSMDEAKTVTATFDLIPSLTLSVDKAGSGSGTVTSEPPGIKCGEACKAEFEEGEGIALFAVPASGSKFTGWQGCDGVGGAVCKVLLDKAKTVTAHFDLTSPTALGEVTEYRQGLGEEAIPFSIASGSDGDIWFTDHGFSRAIGKAGIGAEPPPIVEFAGIQADQITAGPDGNLWFTSDKGQNETQAINFTDLWQAKDRFKCEKVGLEGGATGEIEYSTSSKTLIANVQKALSPILGAKNFSLVSTGLALVVTYEGALAETNVPQITCSVVFSEKGTFVMKTFTEGARDAIGRINLSGEITGEFSSGLNVASSPQAITAGPDGNLWFTDTGATPAIGRVSPGGEITEYGLNGGARPVGITAGSDGNLWFTDAGASPGIGRIAPGGEITEFTLSSETLPEAITAGPDGNLWFTAGGASPGIGRITPGGETTEFDVGEKSVPRKITAGCGGDVVWFSDDGGLRAIGRVTVEGEITEFDIDTKANPYDLTCGSDGNLWFTLPESAAIGRFGTGKTPALTVNCKGEGVVNSAPFADNLCGTHGETGFEVGATVVLTASPAPGWIFTGWSGDCSGVGSCKVTMSSSRSVTATFEMESTTEFNLSVTKSGIGAGTVMSEPPGISCDPECDADFEEGSEVTLIAEAEPGSEFREWTGACSGAEETCMVTMDEAKTVDARFRRERPLLTLVRSGAGTIKSKPKGVACGSSCTKAVGRFYKETTVVLTAKAPTGGALEGWAGCDSSTNTGLEGTCTVTMDEARYVKAAFKAAAKPLVNPQILTLTKAGMGTGTVKATGLACEAACTSTEVEYFGGQTSPPASTAKAPMLVTLAATPSTGSSFSGWSGCDEVDGEGRCRVSMGKAHSVTAQFTPKPRFALVFGKSWGAGTVKSKPKGITCASACSSATASLLEGTTVVLTAKAPTGGALEGWAGCDSSTNTGLEGTCTVTMDEARYVKAAFKAAAKPLVNPQILTLTKAGMGTGTVKATGLACEAACTSTEVEYFGGQTSPPASTAKAPMLVTLAATPSTGSVLAGWEGCDSSTNTELEGTCTISMGKARSVVALFEE